MDLALPGWTREVKHRGTGSGPTQLEPLSQEAAGPGQADASQSTTEAVKGKGKGKGKKKADDRDLESLVSDLARLVLADSSLLRDLAGIVFKTALLSKEIKFAKAAVAAGAEYSSKCKGMTPEQHGQGAPAPHILMAIIRSLGEDTTEAAEQVEIKYAWDVLSLPHATVQLQIRHVRVTKTYDAKKCKLTWSVTDSRIDALLVAEVAKAGGLMKHGKVPAGGLELQVVSKLKARGVWG